MHATHVRSLYAVPTELIQPTFALAGQEDCLKQSTAFKQSGWIVSEILDMRVGNDSAILPASAAL